MTWQHAWIVGLVFLFSAVLASGCEQESAADRARKAAEEIRQSMPNVDADAAAQSLDADTITEVQERLTKLKEYMGEINGELDSVTIHAIQAFQRSVDLPDDGIVDEETLRRLREATGA